MRFVLELFFLVLFIVALLCGHSSAAEWCNNKIGKVVSFGYNSDGQLGDGTYNNRYSPVFVYPDGVLHNQNITRLGAGASSSFALSNSGKPFAFGDNSYGQLGDGSTTDRVYPASVVTDGALSGLKVVAVSGGPYHTLFLSDTGKAFSTGYNVYGQLGLNDTVFYVSEPNAVIGLDSYNIIAIAAGGYHSLVLSAAGQVFSFGYNTYGQLGDGTTTDKNAPVAVDTSGVLNGKTITAISAGSYHSLVLSSIGKVFSFGDNSYGQLGDGTWTSRNTPVAVSTSGVLNGKTITAISAGYYHSLVLSSSGQVFGFGYNSYGQLGDDTGTTNNIPVAVDTSGVLSGKTIISIAAGNRHSLVLSSTKQVFSFGYNYYGQLGDGTSYTRYSPVAVSTSGVLDGLNITAIVGGQYHSLVLAEVENSLVTFSDFSDPEPIDGMYFLVGASTNISWTTSDQLTSDDQITIELFQGTTFISTLFSVSNAVQTVRWNIGDQTPGFYRLRMYNSTDTCSASFSPEFEIVAVEKNLTSVGTPPSYLFVGQQNVSISWQSTSTMGNVRIELIRDGDSTVNMITANYGGGSPFIWPSVTMSGGRRTDFRFRIRSLTYPSVAPATSETFEIDTKQKRYIIQNPTGALGYLLIGTTCTISWTSEGFVGSFVKIELWRDENFITVFANKSISASPIQWTFNAFDGVPADYFFKISSLEVFNVSSDSPIFSVDTVQKTLTDVSTPETFLFVGQSDVAISWKSTGHLGVMSIELIRNGDSTIDVISSNYSGVSPFTWPVVAMSGDRRTDFRFRVRPVLYPTLVDTSDPFEIDIEPKTISTPELSQMYLVVGQTDFAISWSCTGSFGDIVIELIRDGNDTTAVDLIAPRHYSRSSPFIWTVVQASDARRTDYRFRLTAFSYPNVVTTSRAFEIESTIKNITSVEKPSSSLHVDQSDVKIRWTATGYLGDVMIELIRDGNDTTSDVIAANHTGGSPFTWSKVECSDVGQTDYRFRVQSLTYPDVSAASSESFEIDEAVSGANAMVHFFSMLTSAVIVVVAMAVMQSLV